MFPSQTQRQGSRPASSQARAAADDREQRIRSSCVSHQTRWQRERGLPSTTGPSSLTAAAAAQHVAIMAGVMRPPAGATAIPVGVRCTVNRCINGEDWRRISPTPAARSEPTRRARLRERRAVLLDHQTIGGCECGCSLRARSPLQPLMVDVFLPPSPGIYFAVRMSPSFATETSKFVGSEDFLRISQVQHHTRYGLSAKAWALAFLTSSAPRLPQP